MNFSGNLSRRAWLKSTAILAALPSLRALAWLPSRAPRSLAQRALRAAAAGGASYADVRFVRRTEEDLSSRDDHITGVRGGVTYGLGVRVLRHGAFGFAATPDVSEAGIDRAVARALAIAEANEALVLAPVTLAPEPTHRDTWQTPIEKDPFRVPFARKAQLLLEVNRAARGASGGGPLRAVEGFLKGVSEEKSFFSSEGSELGQEIFRVDGGYTLSAVDDRSGRFEHRRFPNSAYGAGFEHLERIGLVERAPELARDLREKLAADTVAPGPRDLVLAADHLWLTIHETIGHSTELDRVLGDEAGFAGTSFAAPGDLGSLRYGGPLVNFVADKTTPGGLATCGYDDDGVETQRFDLIKHGLLVGFQTTRDQVGLPGFGKSGRSSGCSYAESWAAVPFQRMPNVSLVPSATTCSVEDLIAGVQDGIYVQGNDSWSIDQQRKNFQFGGDFFWEIKHGKLTRPLRQIAYQGNTLDFWSKLDGLGDASERRLSGVFNDGKGQPGQSNAVSHGTPCARFRQIDVLDVSSGQR